MEDNKDSSGATKSNDENPSSTTIAVNEVGNDETPSSQQSSRTPFTSLSQVDADLALARTLQEQERAYMMLRLNGDVSDFGSSESGSFAYGDDVDDDEDEEDDHHHLDDENSEVDDGEEDVFDVHAHIEDDDEDDNQALEVDPSAYSSDEAYARALQEAEEREMAMRMLSMAGINDFGGESEDITDHESNSQASYEEVDPDELSYEELLALGEVVGTESRGLSLDTIADLPSISYKAQDKQDGGAEQCVICRLEFDDGESLTALSCKHAYHPECINNWLQINKVCPVCSTEVSTSGSSR